MSIDYIMVAIIANIGNSQDLVHYYHEYSKSSSYIK